jgi:hypothetical protein
VQRRRQKQSLIQIVGAEALPHVFHYKRDTTKLHHFLPFTEIYFRHTPITTVS